MNVSVIVPFYGVEKYIARCAESFMRQTMKCTLKVEQKIGKALQLSANLETFTSKYIFAFS